MQTWTALNIGMYIFDTPNFFTYTLPKVQIE